MGTKETSRCRSSDLFKNYLAWIANLGVVPLFLFSAFLLAPAFFFFLNLLLFVTHVLETIRQLLYNRNISRRINYNILKFVQRCDFKPSFLPVFCSRVKGIFQAFVLIALLSASESHGKATEGPLENTNQEDHIIGKGQSLSLKLPSMTKFNVGNKEVLTYKFEEKSKTLTVRGAKIGYSEILIWENAPVPKKIQFFVITKLQEAKFLHLAELLEGLGLKTTIHLPHLLVGGSITTLKQYLQYKKIQAQSSELILDEVEIEPKLKNSILADIYQLFFNDYKESIKCQALFSEITCLYPSNEAPSESLKKYLNEKYKVSFIEHNNQKLRNNYTFRLKLIQLEQLDGEELRLGLEQLSASLGELLLLPINKIVEKNLVLLSQKKVQMNTLAEPSGVIRPMSPAEFQIGAEVPYTTTSKDGVSTHTQWQFAGLKVKVLLENYGDKVKITYETELTKPALDSSQAGSISGNKEKSSIVIDLSKPTQLFQISLKTDALGVDQMPFLNRIPLLGELFKSKSSQNNYKMITGLIEVKQNE